MFVQLAQLLPEEEAFEIMRLAAAGRRNLSEYLVSSVLSRDPEERVSR
jgi:hypothetical protein